MQKNNAEYDICLIFPPDAGIELCPPAGIPSLVSYIKTKGFRSLVIDLDSVFKKSFLAQNILIHLQGTIMFLFKEMFPGRNITAIDTSYKDTRFNLLELSKNSVALILHYIYKYLIILRIVFFRYKRKRIVYKNRLCVMRIFCLDEFYSANDNRRKRV